MVTISDGMPILTFSASELLEDDNSNRSAASRAFPLCQRGIKGYFSEMCGRKGLLKSPLAPLFQSGEIPIVALCAQARRKRHATILVTRRRDGRKNVRPMACGRFRVFRRNEAKNISIIQPSG